MKHLVINPAGKNIPERLGLTTDKAKEIVGRLDKIIEEETASGEGDHSAVIKRAWNEFADGPEEELSFAMYALRHEEDKVSVNPMEMLLRQIGIAESVESK